MNKFFSKKDIIPLLLVYIELYALYISYSFITDSNLFQAICDFWQDIRGSLFMWLVSYLSMWGLTFYLMLLVIETKSIRWSVLLFYIVSVPFLFVILTEKNLIDVMVPMVTFFACSAISELSRYAHDDVAKKIPEEFYKKGFSPDTVSFENQEKIKWDDFSESLLQRLLHTNIEHSAFAVALTGGWGTGKTTFLEMFKANLDNKRKNYLTFNPWLSNSPDMIIRDYFASLKTKLEELGLHIGNDLDKYLNLLLKYTAPTYKDKIGEIFELNNNDVLVSVRDDISEKLGDLPSPLFVLIDDVDRLQKEEILETLKLIRNTADFRNVIYVVTYDKEYVVQSLKTYNIVKASDFLKKIFQIELKFPKFEKYLLNHSLFMELSKRSQITNYRMREALNGLEMALNEKIDIGNYLQNFRDVKRFANDFCLVLDYIDGQKLWDDFDVVDLFLIELLNYTDESTYLELKNGCMSFLASNNDSVYYYVSSNANGEINNNSQNILKLLFPDNLQTSECKANNICRFYTYFSYRPYAYQIGLTEFNNLLKMSKDEDIKEKISNMNEGIFSKAESLYTLMLHIKLEELGNTVLRNDIVVLIEWTRQNPKIEKEYLANLYGKISLQSKDLDKNVREEIHNKLSLFFQEIMNKKSNIDYFSPIQRILSELEYNSRNIRPGTIPVFTQEEIKKLLHQNTMNFLHRVKPHINQMIEKSRLHDFVMQSIGYAGDNIQYKKHPNKLLIENELIQYFGKKAQNNYHVFFSYFKYEKSTYFRDGQIPDEIKLENKIKNDFCTTEFYMKFLQSCFMYETETTLSNYFKQNKIKA